LLLAISSAWWSSRLAGCRAPPRRAASGFFEFCFPPESYPVEPSGFAAGAAPPPLLGALVPHCTCKAQRSTCRQIPGPAYVPPAGFGYPLDGLLPLSPSEFCFTLTAHLGFALRSFDSTGLGRSVSPRCCAHLPFIRRLISEVAFAYGDAGRGFWGLTRAGSPAA
jgi:hypothetical protein